MAEALKQAGADHLKPKETKAGGTHGSKAEGRRKDLSANKKESSASDAPVPGPNNRIAGPVEFKSAQAKPIEPGRLERKKGKKPANNAQPSKKKKKFAGREYSAQELSVYRPKAKKEIPAKTITPQLEVTAKVAIKPAIIASDEVHINAPIFLTNDGRPVPKNQNPELDFVIGFDFGTTYCKVVLREPAGGRAWAVPLSGNQQNPYLLCTRVWRQLDTFTLAPPGKEEANLKLQLIEDEASESKLATATAFTALLLRHIKAWYWLHLSKEYPGYAPVWLVHMGLPVSNLDDSAIRRRFQRMLWAAMLLSNELTPQIKLVAVQQSLDRVNHAVQAGDQEASLVSCEPVHIDQLRLFPEVAAQIYGYFRSDQRDPSLHTFMLADVGGGTVDAGLFQVTQVGDEAEEVVFSAAVVEKLGVYVLHRHRLAWLCDQLKQDSRCDDVVTELRKLEESGASPSTIPGLIEHYLQGVSYPAQTCDRQFANDFGTLLWRHVVMAARQATGEQFPAGPSLPFLLCGGGRSIELYKQFAKKINAPHSSTLLRLRVIELARPSDLEPRAIKKDDYHRLSVAYGLSFDDIGQVITPKMLPPPPPLAPMPDGFGGYIAKEYC